MKTQNVVVDIGNLKASDIFYVQGEQGREITFKVINSLLEDFVNLAGYTATIHILKSDGNFTIDNMTIDSAKSECYYTLTENDCACGGRGFYDLSFSKNNELIYTAHGDFVGDFRSVNDDSVNSVSSAYGVPFPEGFQEKLIAGNNITIENNVISAGGEQSFNYNDATNKPRINGVELQGNKSTSDLNINIPTYSAGANINISENNVISATDTKYTAGENISISENNVISATGGSSIDIVTEHYSGGNGSTSRTFILPDERIPTFVRIKGYTDGNWHADLSFMWGDTIAYAITDDRHPYNSSYTFNDNITYLDNTFTLVAYNAGCAFNMASSNMNVTYIYL